MTKWYRDESVPYEDPDPDEPFWPAEKHPPSTTPELDEAADYVREQYEPEYPETDW